MRTSNHMRHRSLASAAGKRYTNPDGMRGRSAARTITQGLCSRDGARRLVLIVRRRSCAAARSVSRRRVISHE